MIFLSFINLHVVQKRELTKFINLYIYKLSSADKMLSLLTEKNKCRTCFFLNHFRETNNQQLCALCCYSSLYNTSLPIYGKNIFGNVMFSSSFKYFSLFSMMKYSKALDEIPPSQVGVGLRHDIIRLGFRLKHLVLSGTRRLSSNIETVKSYSNCLTKFIF